jgi:hypothetical protein
VTFRREPQQLECNERPIRKIELPGSLCGAKCCKLIQRCVDDGQLKLERFTESLSRSVRGECCPQRIVPLHDFGDRTLQGLDVQLSEKLERTRLVEGRGCRQTRSAPPANLPLCLGEWCEIRCRGRRRASSCSRQNRRGAAPPHFRGNIR